MTNWFLRKTQEGSDPLKSKILYCIVKISKIKGLIIQDVMDFVPILDNYVVILLKRIACTKDMDVPNGHMKYLFELKWQQRNVDGF